MQKPANQPISSFMGAAIVDAEGQEQPITQAMIDRACDGSQAEPWQQLSQHLSPVQNQAGPTPRQVLQVAQS